MRAARLARLWYHFQSGSGKKRRLKIEINTREHFAGVVELPFNVEHDVIRGAVSIPSHSIEELLATKLRAFTQRDRGRDLFDLWWASRQAEIDPDEIVRLFGVYMTRGGFAVDSAPELRAKTVAKQRKGIFDEVRPLLRTGIAYDPSEALEWFEATIMARLRNDDGTRLFART